MLNREGVALLKILITSQYILHPLVERGDCNRIADYLNGFLPIDTKLSAQDVYSAIKDLPEYQYAKLNADVLRARIDSMPVLYSARMNGDVQAIVNELNALRDIGHHVTVADARAAMLVRPMPTPERVAQGAAAMLGISGF